MVFHESENPLVFLCLEKKNSYESFTKWLAAYLKTLLITQSVLKIDIFVSFQTKCKTCKVFILWIINFLFKNMLGTCLPII